MLNQFVCVGRLNNTKEINEGDVLITLIIPRSYKNEDGIYESDEIEVLLKGQIAKNTLEYCKKGDIIGVKGRLQVIDNKQYIIAEKISFLSSSKSE